MSGNGRTPSKVAVPGELPPDPGVSGLAGNGLDRGRVVDIQRARMLGAMVQEIAERGVASVSVAHVVARSGVSRRTFYEIFEDREDCFLAAFEDALKGIAAVVVPAYRSPGPWRAKIRAGLTVALECLDYDRETACLLIVESLAAGPKALERRQSVLARIIAIVEQGRTEGKRDADPPPLTAEGIVGGVLSVLHARLTPGPSQAMDAPQVGDCGSSPTARSSRARVSDGDSLLELLGPLMGMIVLPYLGPAAARKEIQQPLPKRSAKRPPMRWDPLRELEMRLTYRTVRVLSAVAQAPGSSNRGIGEAAGIGDQGQVSKLLARLRGLGLIENEGVGAATRGEPNAWSLTVKGSEVNNAITSLRG